MIQAPLSTLINIYFRATTLSATPLKITGISTSARKPLPAERAKSVDKKGGELSILFTILSTGVKVSIYKRRYEYSSGMSRSF